MRDILDWPVTTFLLGVCEGILILGIFWVLFTPGKDSGPAAALEEHLEAIDNGDPARAASYLSQSCIDIYTEDDIVKFGSFLETKGLTAREFWKLEDALVGDQYAFLLLRNTLEEQLYWQLFENTDAGWLIQCKDVVP